MSERVNAENKVSDPVAAARADANADAKASAKANVALPALGPREMLRWAWTQLTSMRTALFLLLLLAVAAVPGSLFPQRPANPSVVTQYIKDHPDYGQLLDTLQLYDVYSSAWFSAESSSPWEPASSMITLSRSPSCSRRDTTSGSFKS